MVLREKSCVRRRGLVQKYKVEQSMRELHVKLSQLVVAYVTKHYDRGWPSPQPPALDYQLTSACECSDTVVRGQSPSSMGESFFSPCTRHISPRSDTEFYGGIVFFLLYQARKYVLTSWYFNSFIHSVPRGIIFY